MIDHTKKYVKHRKQTAVTGIAANADNNRCHLLKGNHAYVNILSIISASLSISIASGAPMVQNIRLAHLSVRKSELWQNGCRTPFGVVSGVGRGMGVLDFGGDHRRGRDSFGVNVGHPIVTSGDFVV